DSYRGDAAENAARAQRAGLLLRSLAGKTGLAQLASALGECDVIVDALFGTGLSRGLSGRAAQAVSAINRASRSVVSADLPSGLSADSVELLGPAVSATVTVAFAAAKLCHLFPPARERCGRVVVRDIGIPRAILSPQKSALAISESRDIAELLPP